MCKGKKLKAIIGILLMVALIVSTLIVPLQNAFAVNTDGAVTVARGGYYDLPETVENYGTSDKTLEFDLNILIASTDVCKLGLYNGSTMVSLEFLLRDKEGGLTMMVDELGDGWYHYTIPFATIPRGDGQESSSVTRIRARSTFPSGTKINNISVGINKPEAFTEDYDTVTLADLDLIGKDYETPVKSGSYQYNGKSKTHSVIVKFGWEANISNNIDWKIALDTYWNANCMVWFRPDHIYFCPGDGSFKELRVLADPITSGKHEVEFGRLRVVSGPNHGNDYVFLKIDGEVVASLYTKHYQTEGGYLAYNDVTTVPTYTVHFLNDGLSKQGFSGFLKYEDLNKITVDVLGQEYIYYSKDNTYFMPEMPVIKGKILNGLYNGKTKYNGYTNKDIKLTAKFEDIKYEPYDTISLKDLGVKEKEILNQTNTVYTYEKTAESGGRLFQFVLEPVGDMKNGDGPQIAITNDWSSISYARVWFQSNTRSHIYYSNKPQGTDISTDLSLEPGKQYNIEFAVRVMANKGYEGKKIFEVTVNGEVLVQYVDCKADLSKNIIYFHGGTGSVYLRNQPVYKTVKFYNGNTLMGTYKVERDGLLPKVKEPAAKNGVPFAGWYTAKSGGTLWDENADRVYNDMSLYAHFANVRVIKANVDGKLLTYRVKVGNTLEELPKPQKSGHVFMGWLSDGKLFTGKVSKKMNITASFEAYSFETYDEISLRDLGIKGDLDISNLGPNNTAAYTYDKAAKTGGRVFKGVYIPPENLSNGLQVSFSRRWDENYFAKLRFTKADKIEVYSSGVDGGLPTLTLATEIIGGKEYLFEIGVRVLNNKGYKGIKVLTIYLNGELIFEEFNNKANIEGAEVFFQGWTNTGILRGTDIYKTVSFYDGDKLLSSKKVLRGNTVKSIGKLSNKGDRLFMGWFTEFGEEWNFETNGIYLDTVFKAKFQKRTYPVLLMVDGVLYKRINAFAGESAQIFDIPTKDGFEFDKWLDVDGGEYDMQTKVNAPVTLIASFKEADSDQSTQQSGTLKPIEKEEDKPSNLKYILFGIIGLVVIAAEVCIIIYKKRSKK
ncbi:MAG: InlB B-repeat-containing protein [Oscillospiraceae bacterium]|nr:InlB B-repeat-containing protein [Oscillospiraceae bacterium]